MTTKVTPESHRVCDTPKPAPVVWVIWAVMPNGHCFHLDTCDTEYEAEMSGLFWIERETNNRIIIKRYVLINGVS